MVLILLTYTAPPKYSIDQVDISWSKTGQVRIRHGIGGLILWVAMDGGSKGSTADGREGGRRQGSEGDRIICWLDLIIVNT